MRVADWIIDIGPGAGEHGGHVVAEGTFDQIPQNPDSLTAKFLTGERTIALPKKRRKGHPNCVDCFFHCQMLCALDLDEPCSTFRPNTADGLVPPRQPALLLRETAQEARVA